MTLNAVFKLIAQSLAYALIVWGCIWWVQNIMLDYHDGPPAWTPTETPAQYEVQKDGSVVLLPPVSVTAPTTEQPGVRGD